MVYVSMVVSAFLLSRGPEGGRLTKCYSLGVPNIALYSIIVLVVAI